MPKKKVMLLRTGSTFKIVCSDCRKTIAMDLPGELVANYHARVALDHAAECEGVAARAFQLKRELPKDVRGLLLVLRVLLASALFAGAALALLNGIEQLSNVFEQ